MKTSILSLLTSALAVTAFAADEPAAPTAGCKMMKKEPAPEPACCCAKMMAKPEAAAKKPADLDALVDQLKSAKGDQVLDSLAAVIDQLRAERKAAAGKTPDAKAPEAPAHQH